MNQKEPIIQFKHFTFKYRAQAEPTLYDINLSIYPGEKVLIVGPSGSGKSTLAHCINGLVPFSYKGDIKGEYYIKGNNPEKLGIFGLSKIVGTVLQDTDGQFIGLTVAEDIAFALENDMVEQQEMKQKVLEVANLIDMDALLDHSPRELSGGQKQRVSIGGVMVDDVDILLFDEPLANLDPATGKTTIELIEKLQKEKEVTTVIIEHRLEDVLYKDVDRIVVVSNGRIVADDTPEQILSSNVLEENGIREPLYLTAIKHAGCNILPETKPQHVENMVLDSYKEQVRAWYQKTTRQEKEKSNEEILSIRNLHFSYNQRRPILHDINFTLRKSEMVSIVGKNGAGKSTLAGLICGFMQPNQGDIVYKGKGMRTFSIKEIGENIGLVMQSPNQMISKPMIYDEVALGLRVRGFSEDEVKDRVTETLKICGLYPFRNWPVSALSYGQKKRVTIASILVLRPDIIILDEPTAGQDYKHYTEIMEFLKTLNEEQGITIVMITHDMHLMLEYTDRAIVIADGKLIADDTPANILTNEDIAVKAFLKKTSLYDLAVRCDIPNPSDFADRFIQFDRVTRKERKNQLCQEC